MWCKGTPDLPPAWPHEPPPGAPAGYSVLQRGAEEVEVIPGARGHAAAAVEAQRIPGVERHRHRSTQPPVTQPIVVALAVDRGAPASEPGHVGGGPDARAEAVDGVALDTIDRLLRAPPAVQ